MTGGDGPKVEIVSRRGVLPTPEAAATPEVEEEPAADPAELAAPRPTEAQLRLSQRANRKESDHGRSYRSTDQRAPRATGAGPD